jgi:hypothetical protein
LVRRSFPARPRMRMDGSYIVAISPLKKGRAK